MPSSPKRYGAQPDVYAVQGYDSAALLAAGLEATKGDINATGELYKAMRAAKINSPRGPLSFSASQNPVQNIYLREVKNGKNAYVEHCARGARRSRHWLQAGVSCAERGSIRR